jgi:mannose/fructose/N-acetylgalactosamine-specific phosphotransferase system component IIB
MAARASRPCSRAPAELRAHLKTTVSILLYRVDERLIHGQVVIGWGSQLDPERYLVVDDALAASEWEQELYQLTLPEGLTALFVPVAEAVAHMAEWNADETRSVLLTRDLDTMLRLAEANVLAGAKINLGGIHHAPGRRQVSHYLYLDDADRARIKRLSELGIKVAGRDLPGAMKVSLDTLLEP